MRKGEPGMSKVFILADLHFGHEKAALARGFTSAEEHDAKIIENWNKVVGKRDSVFVLGDVAFGKVNIAKVALLAGTKKLILGNHDTYAIENYQPYFSKIFGCVRYKGYILSHIPVHESEFTRFKGNIHGHLHSKVLADRRYTCVSLEQTGLMVKEFDEVLDQGVRV